MKKHISRFLSIFLLLNLLLPALPAARAAEDLGLDAYIQDGSRRRYVEAMVGYHLRYNPAVVADLEAGYTALFFFEGCSDNMNSRIFYDIRFYRVSAVCLAIRLDEKGKPRIVYFNDGCSTLPDRPLDYANRKKELGRKSGPATVCDGTYQLFSVYHGGRYEALHMRTTQEYETIPAVYMTEDGYAVTQAEMINIHTRDVNHILENQMWSAGCLLVGDGDFSEFTDLVAQAYYPIYDTFEVGVRVGTVTVDRQFLKQELYDLYENKDAVDRITAESRRTLPETYLRGCTEEALTLQNPLWAGPQAEIMTLPCDPETDPRSVLLDQAGKGAVLDITAKVENDRQEVWYKVNWEGQEGYLRPGDTVEPSWYAQLIRSMFSRKKTKA